MGLAQKSVTLGLKISVLVYLSIYQNWRSTDEEEKKKVKNYTLSSELSTNLYFYIQSFKRDTLPPPKLSNCCNSTILTFFFSKMPPTHILFKKKSKKIKNKKKYSSSHICIVNLFFLKKIIIIIK